MSTSITMNICNKLKDLTYEKAIELVGQDGLTLATITRYFDQPNTVNISDYLPEFLKSEKELKQATSALFKTLKADKQVNIFSVPTLFTDVQYNYYDSYGDTHTETYTAGLSLYKNKLIVRNQTELSWTELLNSLKKIKFSVADTTNVDLKKLLIDYMKNSNEFEPQEY